MSYYRGKQYFDEGSGKQNYLVFLPYSKYFKLNSVVKVVDHVLSWQSKGLSNESIKPPATSSDNSLTPELNYYGTETRVKFTGSCLKQSSHILTHEKVVNIYIVYELTASSSHDSNPTIKNCLFGAVTLTKNAGIEKYKYSGYSLMLNHFLNPICGKITTNLTNPSFLLKFSTTCFRHVSAYYQVVFNTDEQFLFYNFIMILKGNKLTRLNKLT